MRSKWMAFAILSLFLGLTGCDQFLRGPQKPQTVRVQPKEFECLKVWPDRAKVFLKDELDEPGTDFLFQCLHNSLKAFSDLASGSVPGLYLDSELREYFNRFLLKDHQVSADFMTELMKLKVVVLGGSQKSLTKEELRLALGFIEILRQQTQMIRGWQQLFFFQKTQAQVSFAELREAQEIYSQVFQNLIQNTQIARSSYEFQDFHSFLKELNNFLSDSEDHQPGVFAKAIRWMPVFESLKSLIFGEPALLRSQKDWRQATQWVSDAYFLSLKSYYHLSDFQLQTPQDSHRLITVMDDVLGLIARAPQLVEKGVLESIYIDEAIDRIYELDFALVKNMKAEMLKTTYKRILSNVIDGVKRGQTQSFEVRGIELRHFKVIEHEYHVWKLAQLANSFVFDKANQLSNSDMVTRLNRFNPQFHLNTMGIRLDQKQALLNTWQDWVKLLQQKPGLFLDPQNRMYVGGEFEKQKLSFNGLSWTSVFRTVTRLLIRGYGQGDSQQFFSSSVTKERLMDFEKDFRDVGIALGLLNPSGKSAAARAFLEGNLFTFHGDGNHSLDSLELIEMLHTMIAAGRGLTQKVHQELSQAPCLTSGRDPYEFQNLSEACFRNYLKNNNQFIFSQMPLMAQYLQSLDGKSEPQFFDLLIAVARGESTPSGSVDYLTVRNSMMVLHYVEVLFSIYDANRDGFLDQLEAEKAYPRFEQFILSRPEMKGQNPKYGYYAFLAIIQTGQIPGKLEIWWDSIKPWRDQFVIDRGQLLRVLAILKKST